MLTEVAFVVCQVRSAVFADCNVAVNDAVGAGVGVPRLMLASFDGGPYWSAELYARTTK